MGNLEGEGKGRRLHIYWRDDDKTRYYSIEASPCPILLFPNSIFQNMTEKNEGGKIHRIPKNHKRRAMEALSAAIVTSITTTLTPSDPSQTRVEIDLEGSCEEGSAKVRRAWKACAYSPLLLGAPPPPTRRRALA